MRPPYEREQRCPRCDCALSDCTSYGYCSAQCRQLHEREKAIRDLRDLLKDVVHAPQCCARTMHQLQQRAAKLRTTTKYLAAS